MATTIIGLDSLNRFMKKCNVVKDVDSLLAKIVLEVARLGDEILTNMYYDSVLPRDNEIPSVSYNIINANQAEIITSGKSVMFIEFGTGTIGKNSGYKGILPTDGVPITGGWKYNYDSESKKTNKQSGIYWTYFSESKGNYVSSKGQVSGQQIFNTARDLERLIPQIAKDILDKEFANV